MRQHPDSLWRDSAFVKLWSGETVSLVGSQVTVVALPLTALRAARPAGAPAAHA